MEAAMHADAERHLKRVDPVMAGLIRTVGPCGLKPEPWRSPFQSLVQAVAHQQLNGRAAETILGRFRALFPTRRFPGPRALESVTDEQLRGVGFSRAKVAAIRDIAARVATGEIPGARRIERLSDEEIIGCLTAARGVGRWTVEMLLMFQLGRPDVMPVDDLGVRNGYRIAYGLDAMPAPRVLLGFSEIWKPHRTVAAWYLWRAVDLAKAPARP
jgi:DNA-3-methyladenine glycosylase II